jgi:hypothetical protein
LDRAALNGRTNDYIALWQALGAILEDEDARPSGRVWIEASGEVVVARIKPVHRSLRDKPILHLDATLRPELGATVLPELAITDIEAATPHMAIRLITGSFGKGGLCPDPRANPGETRRRANRLSECVDYVRWHARRHAPGRTLVITCKDIEGAFADIPGVEVAHFNAVAGLDVYRDVALLIVAGRPPPRDSDLAPIFSSSRQAECAFGRNGFNPHFPMNTSYREMRVKSARYRREGRGRSWQTAWWIDGSAGDAEAMLRLALGGLAAWRHGCRDVATSPKPSLMFEAADALHAGNVL